MRPVPAASHLLLTVLLTAATVACRPPAPGAPSAPEPQPVPPRAGAGQGDLTATMARVAADAADGYRTGRPVHVVVTPGANPRPSVFASRQEAEAAVRAGGVHTGVFVTPPDTLSPQLGRVLAVQVTLLSAGGDTTLWSVPLDSVDLIAWSMPAIEKFVIPYYARLYGADYAQRFRSQYFNTVPYLLYCHDYMSIECPMMETEAALDTGF